MSIHIEKLSAPSISKVSIDTGVGGASPFTWQGLDLVKAPWILYMEGPGIRNWDVNPTAGGLEFNNVQALVPPQIYASFCGLICNGRFLRDSEGFLALSMHFDNFTQATDILDDLNLYAAFEMGFIGSAVTSVGGLNNLGEALYGMKSAGGTNERVYYTDATNGRTSIQTHATPIIDEFEIQIQFRPALLGAPQSATIIESAMDWMRIKRWLGGVPQANEDNAINRTEAGALFQRIQSWIPQIFFFGLVENRVSQQFTARLNFIRLDRGRFAEF